MGQVAAIQGISEDLSTDILMEKEKDYVGAGTEAEDIEKNEIDEADRDVADEDEADIDEADNDIADEDEADFDEADEIE